MNSFPANQFSVRAVGTSQALLGINHGYRFDGDTIHLNAMFTLITPAAHNRAWALQLWACPVAPNSRAELTGHLVAHVALPPIGEIADEVHSFGVSTLAYPPAGRGEHVMVLALVAGDGQEFSEVHDLSVYPRREQFLPLRFGGAVGYRLNGDRVAITVEKIENPRLAGNLSGTLALELWALSAPYHGGAFQGVPLAGVAFNPLPGQWEYHTWSFDLPFAAPPAGSWNLTLMLREWTATGYMTRDFANFDQPFVQPALSEVPPALEAPVVPAIAPAKTAKEKARTAPKKAKVTKPTEVKPATAKALPEKKATPEKIVPVVEAPAAPVIADAKTIVPAKGPATAKAKEGAGMTSVNDATVKELTAVKGLSAKLAQAIVESRPFVSLDALADVKGMGAKLLAKLRPSLKL